MTNKEKERYQSTELLRDILKQALEGKRFKLDCGHNVSFFHFFGNDITIYNGKNPRIICSQCGH